MQVSSYLFDGYFLVLGFRKECLHCANLGNGCNGVHADPKSTDVKTLKFQCEDFEQTAEPNGNAMRVLAKMERRYNRQIERNQRGGER